MALQYVECAMASRKLESPSAEAERTSTISFPEPCDERTLGNGESLTLVGVVSQIKPPEPVVFHGGENLTPRHDTTRQERTPVPPAQAFVRRQVV